MASRFFTLPKPMGDQLAETCPKPAPTDTDTKMAADSKANGNGNVKTIVSDSGEVKIDNTQTVTGPTGITFANQESLPKLPIPDLEATCSRYLESLAPLQTAREHEDTKAAVQDFLKFDGPELQQKLKDYACSKTSYIEQFCRFL